MKRNNKKGFTIVELVIVIAVIAILAGVMIPTFGNIIENANKSNAIQEGKNALTADYADDLVDGSVDGSYTGEGTITYDANGTITGYEFTSSKGYTVEFDGETWTATK